MNRLIVFGCCFAIAFAAGVGAGRFSLSKKISEMREEYAIRESEINSAALQKYEELQEKYRNAEKRINQAIEEKRKAVATADSLRVSVDSLRKRTEESARKYRELSRTSDSCRSQYERVARCTGLLGEGAGLVEEGFRLSNRINANKNILIESLK